MQYVVLDKINKQKVMPNIKNYITAASIYIPITQKTKITLKINDYVYKEQEIIPGIYSPVSGFITSSSLKVNEKGQKVACLVIQNDGKEQYQKPKKNRENYQNYDQEKALELLNSFHFSKLNNIKSTLVINSVEDE